MDHEGGEMKATITQQMRGIPITDDEAEASINRIINSRFNKSNGARCSIPVRPDDDDIVALDYVVECRALRTERDSLKERVAALEKALRCVVDGNDLAFNRGHSMQSWPDSFFRKEAARALSEAGKETA